MWIFEKLCIALVATWPTSMQDIAKVFQFCVSFKQYSVEVTLGGYQYRWGLQTTAQQVC
jgi:hypothetical protein